MLTIEEQIERLVDAAIDQLDQNPAAVDRPANVLDAAWQTGDAGCLDSLRTTPVTLLDNDATPSEPNSGRRWLVPIAAAAAVVVAIAVVATGDDDATPADQPSPTVTATPTTSPRALATSAGELMPGTYFLDGIAKSTTPRISVTVGTGWSGEGNSLSRVEFTDENRRPGEVDIAFGGPAPVLPDACHWKHQRTNPPWPEPTLDGVVTALTEQRGWADVTTASDISIDGYAGKAFQRTAPTDISNCDTTTVAMTPESDRGVLHPEFGGYEPGVIETVWVLDIDGTVVVINATTYPETSAAARAETAAVLDSIRIARASAAVEPAP